MATNSDRSSSSSNAADARRAALAKMRRQRQNGEWIAKLRAKLKRLRKKDPNIYPLY